MPRRFILDAAERIAASLLVAFLSYLLAAISGGVTLGRTLIAVAALTALKTVAARHVGDPSTASLVPW